jgi:hypothetical protein
MTLDLSKQADQLFISNLISKSLHLPTMDTLRLYNVTSYHPYLSDFLTFILPINLNELTLYGQVSPWSNKLSDSLAKRNIGRVRICKGVLDRSKTLINFRCGRRLKKCEESVVRSVTARQRFKVFKRRIKSKRNMCLSF